MMLRIEHFKIVKNRQRPDLCFEYEARIDDCIYSIFTRNGGSTFLASIDKKRRDGRYYEEFKQRDCKSLDEALHAINSNITGIKR